MHNSWGFCNTLTVIVVLTAVGAFCFPSERWPLNLIAWAAQNATAGKHRQKYSLRWVKENILQLNKNVKKLQRGLNDFSSTIPYL